MLNAKDAANAESKYSFNKIAKAVVTHFNAFSAAEDKETFNDAANTAANKFNSFFGKLRDYKWHGGLKGDSSLLTNKRTE